MKLALHSGYDNKAQASVVWFAINAKFPHTCPAVRYLREAVPGSRILELTINQPLSDLLGEIYENRPAVLGIACYIWNIRLVRDLLAILPDILPDTVIVCGGPEVSYETRAFMQEFPMVDYVVRGEGEECVPQLVDLLERSGFDCKAANGALDRCPVDGIAWHDASGRICEGAAVTVPDLSVLPFPYREDELETLSDRILYYETSRGCPFSCAYCLSCATAGVRFLPLPRVFRDLDRFTKHNVRQVKFVDRTFNANPSHFLPILKYIQALPSACRTNFHFEVAVDYLSEEVMEVLRCLPRGRVQLEIGIQSTNESVLRAVSRVNHWEKIQTNIARLMHFGNMHLHVDLIIGLPGEDMASFHRSFNDVFSLHTDMLQLGFLKFLKGASMMRLVRPYGYRYLSMAPYEVLSSDAMSYGDIRWLHSFEKVFELYYNAGRCRHTVSFLIAGAEGGDAFAFWRKFTDWWERQGFHRIGHSAKSLYGHLFHFARTCCGAGEEELDNLLRYDALTADGGRIRPALLRWTCEDRKTPADRFWRGPVEQVQRYLPDFSFTSWQDLRHRYRLEWFDFDVREAETGALLRRKTILLFDFTKEPVSCCPVSLDERDETE